MSSQNKQFLEILIHLLEEKEATVSEEEMLKEIGKRLNGRKRRYKMQLQLEFLKRRLPEYEGIVAEKKLKVMKWLKMRPLGHTALQNHQFNTRPYAREALKAVNASVQASEAEIKTAYRNLELECHPDRNPNDAHAQEKFKEVSTAHLVLSDPNKHRQHDVSGPSENQLDFEGFDVSEMGGVGRVFDALFSKLGAPIPTQIVPKVLEQARQICNGQECDAQTKVLAPGETVTSRVGKQHAHFYEIELLEDFRKNGVAIICKSSSSKFKLVLFDKEGGVRMIQESGKRGKAGTQADMFFVPYTVANIQEFNPMKYHLEDKDTPIAFHYLDSFETQTATLLETRKHYIAVYGDNWISDVKYSITFLPVASGATEQLFEIQNTEKSISIIKKEMLEFQKEFTEAKRKFDEAVAKLKGQDEKILKALGTREDLYNNVVRQSMEPNNKEITQSKTTGGFMGNG